MLCASGFHGFLQHRVNKARRHSSTLTPCRSGFHISREEGAVNASLSLSLRLEGGTVFQTVMLD